MKKRLFLIGLCVVYLCVCFSLPVLAEETTEEPEKMETEILAEAEDVLAESTAEDSETELEKTITAEAEEIEESENTQAGENEAKEPESSDWEIIDGIVKLPEKLELENWFPAGAFDSEILDIKTVIPEIIWDFPTKPSIAVETYSRSIHFNQSNEADNEWIPKEDIQKYINGLSRFTLTKTTEDVYPETFYRHAKLSFGIEFYNPDSVFLDAFVLKLYMRNDVVRIRRYNEEDVYYTVDDPDGFFAYLREAFPEKPRGPVRPSTAPDYLNQPYYIPGQEEENGIPVVDKMEFDVTVDDSYYDTVIEEIADPGDTIHCTVLQARGGYYFFYLILEGPKKTQKYYFKESSFDRQRDPRFTFGNIEIFGKATGGDIKNVELRFRSRGTDTIIHESGSKVYDLYLEKPNPLPAKNFEYEAYVDTSMTMYRYLFNEVPKVTEPEEVQDPTRYKIDLRADYGDNKWDFDINLATKFGIDTSGFKAPDWAKKIGADESAEVTFLNIASYANGKYHLDNPAINIKGDKGDTWFWLNSAELRPDNSFVTPNLNDKKTVLLRFGSCISFNGFTVIRNTVEYETLSVRFVFTDDEKTELDYIEIDFGGSKIVKTDAKDIDYIGDSKAVYEHWIGGNGL